MAVQEWKKVSTNRDSWQCKKGRKYEPTEIDGNARKEGSMNQQRLMAVQERKEVWTNRDWWQCKNGRKYEPTEIDSNERMEESMNHQRWQSVSERKKVWTNRDRWQWKKVWTISGVSAVSPGHAWLGWTFQGSLTSSPVLTLAWYVRYKRALSASKQAFTAPHVYNS